MKQQEPVYFLYLHRYNETDLYNVINKLLLKLTYIIT